MAGPHSSKRKNKVFTDVYNMAGDIHKRPNYLKTIIFDQTMFKNRASYSEAIVDSYLPSSGITMRRVVPYARKLNYFNKIGQTNASIRIPKVLDNEIVRYVLERRFNKLLRIFSSDIDTADVDWWGIRYLLENAPERLNEIMDIDYQPGYGDILIRFYETADSEEPYELLYFDVDDLDVDPLAEYLYVKYAEDGEPVTVDSEYGDDEIVDEFPSVAGYGDVVSDETTPTLFEWEDTVQIEDIYPTYSDVQSTKTNSSETQAIRIRLYSKTDVEADVGPNARPTRKTSNIQLTNTWLLVPEVTTESQIFPTFTRITTTTVYSLVPTKKAKVSWELVETFSMNKQKLFIYKRGTGDGELDALFSNVIEEGGYFPVIPIKVDIKTGTNPKSVFIDRDKIVYPSSGSTPSWDGGLVASTGSRSGGLSERPPKEDPPDPDASIDHLQGLYSLNKKLFKKISGNKKGYQKVLDGLKENASVGDINNVYLMHAVPLNTPENAGKKYIYHFFDHISSLSPNADREYATYQGLWDAAHASAIAYGEWLDAQKDKDNPLFGTIEPGIRPYPQLPTASVSLKTLTAFRLNYSVSWGKVVKSSGTGKAYPDMKTGEVRITKAGTSRDEIRFDNNGSFIFKYFSSDSATEIIEIRYQDKVDSWVSLRVYGLQSANIINRGKGINVSAYAALDDPEESELLIPVNNAVFSSMRLIDRTQLAVTMSYVVLNYYAEYKEKWYQRDFGKAIIMFALIVITVLTFGAGAPLTSGVGAIVAATVGATGIAALIIATAVNALVGMIVSRLVTKAAVAVFGEKIGMLIGAIVSVMVMNGLNSYMNTGTVNIMSSFTAPNLIRMGSAISQDMAKTMQQESANIMEAMKGAQEEFQAVSDQLTKLYENEFADSTFFDPLKFLEKSKNSQETFELPDLFFARTLMTGSDIADLSNNAIEATINLEYTIGNQ